MKTQKTIPGLVVKTEAAQRAFAVVDGLDMLENQLRPFRAVEALAMNEKLGSEEGMGGLQRSDLAILICVLTMNVQTHLAETREAAVAHARGLAG